MARVGDPGQAGRTILADHARDPAPPDIADAVRPGQIGVIGRMARFIPVTRMMSGPKLVGALE